MGQDLVLPEGSVINMNNCSHKSETIQEASDVPWNSQEKLSCSTTLILKGFPSQKWLFLGQGTKTNSSSVKKSSITKGISLVLYQAQSYTGTAPDALK